MTGIAATGGSTNGILHLLAIAREAGVPLTLDELAEIGARTPVIASLAPSGRYAAEDLHRAGGTAAVIGELVRGGLFDGEAPAVTGETLAEATREAPTPDGEVVFPFEHPFKATGALHALRGNLAPEGSLVKASGSVRRHQRGPARVFDSEETCTTAVRNGVVQDGEVLVVRYEGPGGRPGHAGDAGRDRVRRRRRARRVRRARHRRSLLGRDSRADGRPRRARSRARRAACDRARRRSDRDRRRRRARSRSSSNLPRSKRGSRRGSRRRSRTTTACSRATGCSSARPPKAQSFGNAEHATMRACRPSSRSRASLGSTRVAAVPEADGDGVLLRVLEVGVCGTDREISHGLFGIAPDDGAELVLGHELLGLVERDGHGFTRGDLVTATVRRSCRHCLACSEGFPDSCLTGDYVERGITRLNGFASELVVEDPGQLVPIPRSLGRLGVLAEPASICERALRHARAIGNRQPWELQRALVLGAGAVGTLATYLLRLSGVEVWTASLEPSHDLVTAVRRAVRPAAGDAAAGAGRIRPGRRGSR